MKQKMHLRDSPVTTLSMVALRHGLHVHCGCGHVGRLTPDQIALAPDTQIFDYKCRLRCSRCGRLGASDQVEVRNFIENAPFTTPVRAHPRGTPPQLSPW
jgi:hypothetical protein